MGSIDHELREGVQDVLEAAGVRVIVAVIAHVDDDRQATLDDFVHAHEPWVVEVDFLGVGVDFHAFEAEANGSLDLFFRIGVVLMHGHEAREFGMRFAFAGDEVIDRFHRFGFGGDRMHDEVGDGGFVHG